MPGSILHSQFPGLITESFFDLLSKLLLKKSICILINKQ